MVECIYEYSRGPQFSNHQIFYIFNGAVASTVVVTFFTPNEFADQPQMQQN